MNSATTGRSELSARDRAVLRAAADLRLVTGGQLLRLVFGAPNATSHNARLARRCLQRLATAGLLLRLERRVGGQRAGSSSYVYALSALGSRAVDRRLGGGRQREPSLLFLRHTLAISETYVQLHEALYSGRFEQLRLTTEPRCWRWLDDGTGRILKSDLLLTAATGSEDLFAFLEIDLGTEHASAVQRKVSLYSAWRATGREQAALGGFPVVLWLVPDERRRTQLGGYLSRMTRDQPGLHRVLLQEELIDYLTKGGDDERRTRT